MTGALIQLVANSGAPQNMWLDHDPQISFFKKVFRRPTPFATEMVQLLFKSVVDFDSSTSIDILPIGDLMNRIFLVFDIPKLAAMFPNTKSQDIQRVINESSMLDQLLISKLKSLVSMNDKIELDNLFQIIESTTNKYSKEKQIILNMIEVLEKYFDDIDRDQIFHRPRYPATLLLDSEVCGCPENTDTSNHFDSFKNDLADQMINQRKEYVLIHELVKLMYYSEKEIAELTPIISQHNIKHIIQTEIFNELFPNKEIQELHYAKKSNDVLEYEFGSDFSHVLNTYNAIINVLQLLGKSIPIVVIKPYAIDMSKYNIYHPHSKSIPLINQNYETMIDPNYQMDYIISSDSDYSTSHLTESYNLFYPTKTPNRYLELYHEHVIGMFDNIRHHMDQLFNKYQTQIFTQTENLFFNNALPYSNIYSYVVPKENYQDDQEQRIKNVFNANIWFFYFFKYLDSFDESDFVAHQKLSLTMNGSLILKNMIRLLKINLEYYMNECSYLLNDLYANCPSKIPSDTMKNYVPISQQLVSNLLAVTVIFHRNLIPTVSEMFQYIYHFISSISIENIEQYLDVKLGKISDEEMMHVREIGKLIYHYIYDHFINIYNGFRFESPITNTNVCDDQMVKKYVQNFLKGLQTLSQMEFYFVAEMIHIGEQQKLYHDILLNQKFVREKAGDLAGDLIEHINREFKKNINELYYVTNNISRFNGESYINTPYQSRFFGKIPKLNSDLPLEMPIPLPPNNPYGINNNFFNNHHLCIGKSFFDQKLRSEIPVRWCPKLKHRMLHTYYDHEQIQNENIDYFRIKHELLQPSKIPNDIAFVSDYQLNLLRLHKLTSHLIGIYPVLNMELLKRISTSIHYLISFIEDASLETLLEKYLMDIDDSLVHSELKINISFLDQLNELITDKIHQIPYHVSQLIINNQYIHNGNTSNAIIDQIISMRNNFLSQYYYYVLHYDSIIKLEHFGDSIYQNNQEFNIGQIVNQIVKCISNEKTFFTDFEQIPSLFYVYPEMFPAEIDRLHKIINQMDDFSNYVIKLILTFLSSNKPSKLTINDFVNIINTTFESVRMIYCSLERTNMIDNYLEKLLPYQMMMMDHLSMINKIRSYINSLPDHKYLDHENIADILKMVEKYGINIHELNEFLKSQFVPLYNSVVIQHHNNKYQRLSIINCLRIELEYLIVKNKINLVLKPNITFKKLIIKMITKCFPEIKHYFKYIDDEYYSFIYFFIKYASVHQLKMSNIENPIFSMGEKINQDWNNIDLHYQSFSCVSNLLQYLMDYLWDCSMTTCTSSYYGNDRISQMFYQKYNDLMLPDELNENPKNIDFLHKMMPEISEIIERALIKNHGGTNQKYLKELANHHHLIDFIKEYMQKNMVILHQQIQELNLIKHKIENILYRNKQAKMAWVRKLGHFFVKEATFKFGDQVANHHISDWFETYHEISKNEGTESGYLKMIGNREDLIIFNDKVKNAYTIVMPLVFYFNNHVMLSVPLNASINTKYQIEMKFRSVDDLIYKEEFSEFINPDTKQIPYVPHIQYPHLMVEYIYLSTEERRIFASSRLEYLFKEMQYDTITIGDKNLVPIYQLGTTEKTRTIIKNRKKIKEKYYDKRKTVYVNQSELNESQCYDALIPRNDATPTNYIDQTGCPKIMMIPVPLPNTNQYIHYKQYVVDNRFYHPSELMIILIKPLIHTDLSYRTINSNYFYGEKQWDNYGLYSYHDLSEINLIKNYYYQSIKQKINNIEDPQFGYLNLINQLLIDYGTDYPIPLNQLDTTDKWIDQNLSLFQESIHLIKDAYLNYHLEIKYGDHTIKLKEDLLSCNITFRITNYQMMECLLTDVIHQLGYQISSELISKSVSNMNFTSPKLFSESIHKIIKNIIVDKINFEHVDRIISNVYNKYNEAMINFLITNIDQTFAINEMPYDLFNLISYFYNIYITTSFASDDMVNAIIDVKNHLDQMNTIRMHDLNSRRVNFITYKDITQQIIYHGTKNIVDVYQLLIPHYIINMITEKMQKKIIQIFNDQYVELVDYHKYMFNNPKVNPLISGYLKFNGINIMPENSVGIMWSEAQSYQYLNHTPSVGVNLHSWSLNSLSTQPQGSANLSRIEKFESVLNVHPLISDQYPASVVTMISSLNIMRYLSGMCGKAWETRT